MDTFKVIIAGGRWFKGKDLVFEKCDFYLKNKSNIEVITGECKTGADQFGKEWAKSKGHKYTPFPAEWDNLDVEKCLIRTNKKGKKYNALAGPNRNEAMAKYANALIAFWDGKSTGTGGMIELARANGLLVKIVKT